MGGEVWSIGVDVGGKGKGFHLALLRGAELHIEKHGILEARYVLAAIRCHVKEDRQIGAIGIDSPQNWAPGDDLSRPCERKYRSKDLSGIYFTPNKKRADKNKKKFYGWVKNGLTLYELLAKEDIHRAIEVFPTGSWTRWCGKKGKLSRAKWTTRGVQSLEEKFDFETQGRATNQDKRDAVAAAVTAQLFMEGKSEAIEAGDLKHEASLAAGIVIPQKRLGG